MDKVSVKALLYVLSILKTPFKTKKQTPPSLRNRIPKEGISVYIWLISAMHSFFPVSLRTLTPLIVSPFDARCSLLAADPSSRLPTLYTVPFELRCNRSFLKSFSRPRHSLDSLLFVWRSDDTWPIGTCSSFGRRHGRIPRGTTSASCSLSPFDLTTVSLHSPDSREPFRPLRPSARR